MPTFITYLLVSLTSYLGLLLGVILINMAPEEQKPGKKYFIFLKKILFFLIIASLLLYYSQNILLNIFILVFIIILMLNKKMNLNKSILVYLFFGIIFYLSSKDLNLLVIQSTLIFLYGVPNSSLILDRKKKNYYDIFVKNAVFFIPIIFLSLI